MSKVLLQPAYVLHTRPYRETSLLLELFTPEYGRLSAIAKGVRKTKSALMGLLQPFVPLLVSWSGKSELMTLTQVEAQGLIQHLSGDCLFAGLYLNELMMYLLQKWDVHKNLFIHYGNVLLSLQTQPLQEKLLRSFEKQLLEELGYAFLPQSESMLQNTFLPDQWYRFIPEHGFVLAQPIDEKLSQPSLFLGENLIAIAREDWQNEATLFDAKRLIRFVLAPLLGNKTIYSRLFFL